MATLEAKIKEVQNKIELKYVQFAALKLDNIQKDYEKMCSLAREEKFKDAENICERLKKELEKEEEPIFRRVYADLQSFHANRIQPGLDSIWDVKFDYAVTKGIKYTVLVSERKNEKKNLSGIIENMFNVNRFVNGFGWTNVYYNLAPNGKRALVQFCTREESEWDRRNVYVINVDGTKPNEMFKEKDMHFDSLQWIDDKAFVVRTASSLNEIEFKLVDITADNIAVNIRPYEEKKNYTGPSRMVRSLE